MPQTAILGAGVMGETLLSGLVRAGRRVDDLLVGEKRSERARELEERYGVLVVSNLEAARKADTLALVVKPQDMGDLLDEIAPELRPGQLVVSLAAGITTAFIESRVPEGVAVVRVMPNTPALVDQGMAAISAGSRGAAASAGSPRRATPCATVCRATLSSDGSSPRDGALPQADSASRAASAATPRADFAFIARFIARVIARISPNRRTCGPSGCPGPSRKAARGH